MVYVEVGDFCASLSHPASLLNCLIVGSSFAADSFNVLAIH